MKKHQLILLLILFVAFSFRFYDLGKVPVGFHRDEAFLGYNAYSIYQTAKDMSGDFLPLHLKSFLNSPAGYSYFSIPFIALFGLSEFSVRAAAALFGSLTVLTTYLLVVEIFEKMNPKKLRLGLANIASFLLAISPWHINLSRVATENVLVVFLVTLGLLLYFKWLKKTSNWLLCGSLLSFGLSLILYQAPRAFLPLLLPVLFLVFPKKPYKKNLLLISSVFLMTIIIPVIAILSSHNLSQRIRMLSIFNHPETQLTLDEQIREDGGTNNSIIQTRIVHNKLTNYSSTFLNNYFKHFSYEFLFTDSGLPDRYRVPGMGLLYLYELPFLILGMWGLIRYDKRLAAFLGIWILLAPAGSALTFDDIPNLQRTLIIFPAISIVGAFGLLQFGQLFRSHRFYFIIRLALIFIMTYGLFYYFHQYYVHQVKHRPWYRQEGARALVEEVNKRLPSYDKVVVTNWDSTPGIFFLFFTKYDPATLQQQTAGLHPEYLSTGNFGKYFFTREECFAREEMKLDLSTGKIVGRIRGEKNVLYANYGECKLPKAKIKQLADIKRSDGTTIFKLVEVID